MVRGWISLKKIKGFFPSFLWHSWGEVAEKSSYPKWLNLGLGCASPKAPELFKALLRLLYLEILKWRPFHPAWISDTFSCHLTGSPWERELASIRSQHKTARFFFFFLIPVLPSKKRVLMNFESLKPFGRAQQRVGCLVCEWSVISLIFPVIKLILESFGCPFSHPGPTHWCWHQAERIAFACGFFYLLQIPPLLWVFFCYYWPHFFSTTMFSLGKCPVLGTAWERSCEGSVKRWMISEPLCE